MDNKKKIKTVKNKLKEFEKLTVPTQNRLYRKRIRLEKHIQLLQEGVGVKAVTNGFIVNGEFFIGAVNNRWRAMGKNKWYYYSNIKEFVRKYVRNEA